MTYEEMITKLAATEITDIERGENLIRSMIKTMDAIMNYKYVSEHYKGDAPGVMIDQTNIIKNALVVMIGDMDIFMEVLHITNAVQYKAERRITKIINKVENNTREST